MQRCGMPAPRPPQPAQLAALRSCCRRTEAPACPSWRDCRAWLRTPRRSPGSLPRCRQQSSLLDWRTGSSAQGTMRSCTTDRQARQSVWRADTRMSPLDLETCQSTSCVGRGWRLGRREPQSGRAWSRSLRGKQARSSARRPRASCLRGERAGQGRPLGPNARARLCGPCTSAARATRSGAATRSAQPVQACPGPCALCISCLHLCCVGGLRGLPRACFSAMQPFWGPSSLVVREDVYVLRATDMLW